VTLAEAVLGARVRIVDVEVEEEVRGWLHAVGLSMGEEVVVLRRALLGGPLHVRAMSGGEFAVARELARSIAVEAPAA
jgi:ferrous iron transport protein A